MNFPLEHLQSEVAKKHRIGTKLVTGHLVKYFNEATELYIAYLMQNIKTNKNI